MNKEKLQDSCDILEKLVIETAKLYNSDMITPNQKALLETTIGAAIWYLPSSYELYSGLISKEAINKIKEGIPLSKLTQEHRFPRKLAGKILLEKYYEKLTTNEVSLLDLYLNEFGKFNLVVKNENRKLIKFQKCSTFIDDTTSYKDAGIELVKMSIEDIKALQKEINIIQLENKDSELDQGFPPNKDVYVDDLEKYPELFEKNEEDNNQYEVDLEEPNAIQDPKPDINLNNFNFTGININGNEIIRQSNATACYKAFMKYIIDNFEDAIPNSPLLYTLFKNEESKHDLGTDVEKYPTLIINQGNYFFNSHANSGTKMNRINSIANELELTVEFLFD